MKETVDTDVMELWTEFGSGQNQVYLLVDIICDVLGIEKYKGLLFFHAFTGCDQTSFLANCLKKVLG